MIYHNGEYLILGGVGRFKNRGRGLVTWIIGLIIGVIGDSS